MRVAWKGVAFSLLFVGASFVACSSTSKTLKGGVGAGGDDTSGGSPAGSGTVSTGSSSGQVCGTKVGPDVPGNCTLCVPVTSAGSTGASTSATSGGTTTATTTGGFTGTGTTTTGGGTKCQANGCLGGLWCDKEAPHKPEELGCIPPVSCGGPSSTTGSAVGTGGTGASGPSSATSNTGVGPGTSVSSTGSGGGCAHSECVAGAALAIACSACAQTVCSTDMFCCMNMWDPQCVMEAGSKCGICGSPSSSTGGVDAGF